MATGIFFVALEDLKQQADEFGLKGKDRIKFLKEEWQKIQDAKLEKERFEREERRFEIEAEQKRIESAAEEKRLERKIEKKRFEKSWRLSCIGVGDRGAGGAIALPFVKFGTVASKIRATQNIFWAVFDHTKTVV